MDQTKEETLQEKKKAESQEKVRRYRGFLHAIRVKWPQLAVWDP